MGLQGYCAMGGVLWGCPTGGVLSGRPMGASHLSDSKSASPMIAQTSHPPTRNLSGKPHAADGGGPRNRAHSAQEASKMASGQPKKPPRRPLEGSQGCGHLFLGRKNYLARHTTGHRRSKRQELRDRATTRLGAAPRRSEESSGAPPGEAA